jgi:chaperone required for assembly of F1-ATPase
MRFGLAGNIKRFYKDVSIKNTHGQYTILLDGREILTPKKNILVSPSLYCAKRILVEWESQEKFVDYNNMPITRVSFTVTDINKSELEEIISNIIYTLKADLILYRASHPKELHLRQRENWDHIVDYHYKINGYKFNKTDSIQYVLQPESSISGITKILNNYSDIENILIHNCTKILGSCLITLACKDNYINPEKSWVIANIDDTWQEEKWGKDDEKIKRQTLLKKDFLTYMEFIHKI